MNSCQVKKMFSNIPINKEALAIEFNVLEKKHNKVRGLESLSYYDYDMSATIKQINTSDTIIEITKPIFIVWENFEIKNMKGESVDSLIKDYDFTLIFNPETYELYNKPTKLKPKEFSIDTINLVHDFNFSILNEPDTFLIRIKNYFLEENIYSNWDTLIIN